MEEQKQDVEIYNLGAELDKSKEFVDMYTKAYNFNKDRFEAYGELMAFYQGNQHLLSKYKTNRPWVVNMNTPYATVAIENRISSLKSNDYEGDILPLSPEDIDIIEPLDKAQKREWKRMNIDNIINQSIDMGSVVREAYCHITVDKSGYIGGKGGRVQGALRAEIVDPSCILIDPTARSLRDAGYMIRLGRISEKEAYKNYPKLEALSIKSGTSTPEQRGEVYHDNDYNTEQDNVFTEWNFYIKQDKDIRKVKLINNIIVEDSPIKISRFPIAQFRWRKAAQSCYGLSLMDQLLSLQKAVCSIESAITNTAIAYAAPSMMVSKSSGVDPKKLAQSNGAPGIVYSVNGRLDDAIRPVIPPKIEQEILNIKSDFELKIKEISGNSGQFLGNIGTAANTSGGAELAVDRAKIIEVGVTSNIGEYVEDIVGIIVEFVTKLYPGKILNYLSGKDGKNRFVFDKIKIPKENKLQDIQYNWNIELDKKTQYSKDKQKTELKDLFQFESQYDVPIKTITVADIIKNSDLENKDEIIERFNSLSYQSAEEKAKTISQLLSISTEMGIAQDLVTASITEIIANQKETPATDELMGAIQSGFEQQMNEANDMVNESQNVQVSPNVTQEDMAQAQQMVDSGQTNI